MVEKGGAVRRSRRAASLTAEVLWNIQIEDDAKPAGAKTPALSGSKPSVSKEVQETAEKFQKPKRGRKRNVAIKPSTAKDRSDVTTLEPVDSKKKKLSPGYSGHIFPVTKPLQVRRPKPGEKLTASVAPLVNTQPILQKRTTVTADRTSAAVPHGNPILLLPVSLQANQGNGQGDSPNVGGLSLVTLQAPQDLFNCFRFNKTIENSNQNRKQWSTVAKAPDSLSTTARFSGNTGATVLANLARQQVQSYTNLNKTQAISTGPVNHQVEPLNLKMGETTVPSSKSKTLARILPVTAQNLNLPRLTEKEKPKIPCTNNKKPSSIPTSSKQPQSSKLISIKIKSIGKKKGTVPVPPSKQALSLGVGKKQPKSPSSDYVCSSPDVDDLHLEPRHSCKRQRINLRHKAAPPPGTLEYEESVEVQRRLLAEIKRAQKAKARAKAKLEAKKAKPTLKDLDEDRPLVVPEFKYQTPEESNNGWKWTGKPYSSFVFSVTCGKYVQRCCYPGMTRLEKDGTSVVLVRDCVFLLAGGSDELPYIAKVSALWEKPGTKEMMLSLVWFYRPEHTEDPKVVTVSEDELFLSRHQDEISVACVEERCRVLTYTQFCRAQASLRRDDLWKEHDIRNIVPRTKPSQFRRPDIPGESPLDPEDMFYCRQLYDVMQRRVRAKLPTPTSLWQEHRQRTSVSSM